MSVLCLLLAVFTASCARDDRPVYDPYKDKDEENNSVPDANYPGREESRFLSVADYQEFPGDANSTIPDSAPFDEAKRTAELRQVYDISSPPEYRLGPGDVLEIIYQLRNLKRDDVYRIEIMDVIRISFPYTPRYDTELTVRSDGNLNLPIIGDVAVAGRTTAEVHDEIAERYAAYLKEPVVQVLIVRSNNAIEELKRAITTAPRGQSRLEPVRPDGFISLPLVGDTMASGLTVAELRETLANSYREVGVIDIDVTVVLLEVKSPVVYVFGRVNRPGAITMQGPLDVWRAVGEAGGFTTDADRQNVILTRSTREGDVRHILDFLAWQMGEGLRNNSAVQRGDIIFVPESASRYVYVLGEVEKPGRIALGQEETIRASQALAMGGRILSSASREQVLILRTNKRREPIVIEVNLLDIVDSRSYNQPGDYVPRDPVLQTGDVVYVPSSTIGDIDRFAEAWFTNGIWAIIPFNVTATYNLND